MPDINEKPITFNQEQYNLIKKCSESNDISEWNQWRVNNIREKVVLKGADLRGFYLNGINLNVADLEGANLEKANLREAQLFNTNMSKTILRGANLEEAYFVETILDSALLTNAKLKDSIFLGVKATNSNFDYADFKNTNIKMSHMVNCTFISADFSYAEIWDAYSGPKNRESVFRNCNFKDSSFINTIAKNIDFRHSDFSNVTFNGADLSQSNLWYAKFNIDEIKKAKRLFHTKFLLDDYNDYLALREQEIFFCYDKQYKLLLKCSDKKDMSEWNEWNPHTGYMSTGKNIYLAGADLENLYLKKARLENADLRGALFIHTDLNGVDLESANLEEAYMNNSPCFDHAFLRNANLKNADLGTATFRNASLFAADLENTDLGLADFSDADLRRANLKNSKSTLAANFKKANLFGANLEGANFYKCNLSGVNFERGIVDGTTSMYQCQIDRETDFRCVSLDSIGIDSTTKRLLEYNIRRKNWDDWYWLTTYEEEKKIYTGHSPQKEIVGRNIVRFIITLPIRGFWWISDYGTSPGRIMKVFILIWFVFTLIYFYFRKSIDNLVIRKGKFAKRATKIQLLWRSAYFSASTMTTLSCGDMHPKPYSKGQLIVIIQVIIAYFLLAELITFLGILFTSGGPFLIYRFPHL